MSGFAAFHRKAVTDLAADGAVRHVAQAVSPMDPESHGEEAESLRRSGVNLLLAARALAAARQPVDLHPHRHRSSPTHDRGCCRNGLAVGARR